MEVCVALLRGVNVGGAGRLPMGDFARLLGELGLEGARTYIQSGNAAFACPEAALPGLAGRIAAGVAERFGFEPRVLVRSLGELEAAIKANPFPEAAGSPETLHLGFLEAIPPRPELGRLEALRAAGERFELRGATFYLHAPGGVGRSRLAASSERLLGVALTDRNWRTVLALRELARGLLAAEGS